MLIIFLFSSSVMHSVEMLEKWGFTVALNFLLLGSSIKDVRTLGWGGGGEGGQAKVDKCGDSGRGVVSQMWTSAWKKNYGYHICEIYSYKMTVCLCIMSCPCVTFTSWSNPSVGKLLLSKLPNRKTRVYIQYQNDQFFLHFSVNCSQVAMFQIMPALCLHELGEWGGQRNVDRPGQGEGGVPKIPKFVQTSFMETLSVMSIRSKFS